LAAHRQTAAVAQTTIAADVAQPGDVLEYLPLQRPLDGVFLVEDGRQPADLVVRQLLGTPLRIDARLFADAQRQGRADTVDVTEGNMRRLIARQVHTQNTRHDVLPLSLPLALLVARIAANDVQAAVPPH